MGHPALSKLSGEVLRFGVVGICATLTHAGVLYLAVEHLGFAPAPGNLLAFSVAVCVTYAGQSLWVFRVRGMSWGRSARFLVTALTGFVLNGLIMAGVTGGLGLNYWIGFAAVVACVPAFTFVLSKLWVFAPGRRSAPAQD